MRARALSVLSLGVALSIASLALGQDRPHHGPPAEALAACSGRSRGDACTFSGRGGESLSGTCVSPPDLPLACMPAGGPHRHGPLPPEAIEACEDIAIGDACLVSTPHGDLEGTCRDTPEGAACLPARPPHPRAE